jgi:hypothetical protein
MKKYLHCCTLTFLIFSCKENTKVTTTKFTDVAIKDTIIPALTIATDTLKIDSVKMATEKNDSILPGISIGGIIIGETAEVLIQKKGIPDSSDTGMNKAYNEWIAKPTMQGADTTETSFKTFSVVSGKNEKETASRVKRIRITSPTYKTAMQVKVGSTLAYVKLQYPLLKKPVAKAEAINGDEMELYNEAKEGIAFEIVNDRCVAIIIHEKDKKYFNTTF